MAKSFTASVALLVIFISYIVRPIQKIITISIKLSFKNIC
jgi:hypothetical protein